MAGIGPCGAGISGKKKPGHGAVVLALGLLAGCGTVRPTGPEVAGEVARGAELAPWLAARGYEPIRPAMGGPRSGATCVEKARGGAIGGVDVVRVCFEAAGPPSAIFTMQTHGLPWREVWPRDRVLDCVAGRCEERQP